MNRLQVFAGNSNVPLTEAICEHLGIQMGDASVGRFPNGEVQVKLQDDVRGADVFIVQSTCYPVNDNLMELLILIDCVRRASAFRVTAVIPHFGYDRQDRKDEGRVPITAKLVANLITAAGADRVLTVDFHSAQIQGFFDIPVDHLHAFPIFLEHYSALNLKDCVVVSPDAGSIKLARAYAEKLDARLAMVDKRRINPEEAEVGFVIGEVDGMNVIMVDDRIDTGGTIVSAVKTLKEKGAKDVYLGTSHAVFCGPICERFSTIKIKELAVTDTIPINENGKKCGAKVLSVAPLLGEAIRRIHTNQSVSSLLQ